MKRLLLLTLPLLLTGCHSVERYNRDISRLKSPEELKADVDYAYRKITRLHPDLYWYIPETEFRYKFDSLKATINRPLDSYAFYEKLAPVVASVRQGHMSLRPPLKRYTKAEGKALAAKGTGPFSQFDFGLYDNRLFVLKNKSYDKSVREGTEVVAIDGQPVSDLVRDFNRLFTSDGFNTTFKRNRLERSFSSFYTARFGIKDSLRYAFRRNDSVQTVTILRRKENDTVKKKQPVAKPVVVTRPSRKMQRLKGYNPETGLHNRDLRFVGADSSVAVLKIRGFSIGNYRKYYKLAFKTIRERKAHTLILDVRDNPGGRLAEILDLYAYMTDSTRVVCQPSLVTSRTSLLHSNYFDGAGAVDLVFRSLGAPIFYGVQYFRVHKGKDGKFYADTDDRVKVKKENHFDGAVYVLVNGGSFSASSLIANLLKGSGRAYVVGEETGGAYNGTVAGQMPVFTLPHTKTTLRIGLMKIATIYANEPDGYGVLPDTELPPNLSARLSGKDVEMDWVLDHIKDTREKGIGNAQP